jgi:hypothetical protein
MAGGRATVAQPLTLLPHELARMLSDAAELTVKRYRIEAGAERAYLSKNEAYRRYGRSVVDRWLREGLVELHKDGNGNLACRISAIQLEVAAKASNYESFFGYRPEK